MSDNDKLQTNGNGALAEVLSSLPGDIGELLKAGSDSLRAKTDESKRKRDEKQRQEQAERDNAWEDWERAARRLIPAMFLPYVDFGKLINPDKMPSRNEYVPVRIPGFETLDYFIIRAGDNPYALNEKEFTFYDFELKKPHQYDDEPRWAVESDRNTSWTVEDVGEALAIAFRLGQKRLALEAEAEEKNKEIERLDEEKRRARESEAETDTGERPPVEDEETEARKLEDEADRFVNKMANHGPRFINHLIVAALRKVAYIEGQNAYMDYSDV